MKNYYFLLLLAVLSSCSSQKVIGELSDREINQKVTKTMSRSAGIKIVVQNGKRVNHYPNSYCSGTRPIAGCWRFVDYGVPYTDFSSDIEPWTWVETSIDKFHFIIDKCDEYLNPNNLYTRYSRESDFYIERPVTSLSITYDSSNEIIARKAIDGYYRISQPSDDQLEVYVDFDAVTKDYLFDSYRSTLTYLESCHTIHTFENAFNEWHHFLSHTMDDFGDEYIATDSIRSVMHSIYTAKGSSRINDSIYSALNKMYSDSIAPSMLFPIIEHHAFTSNSVLLATLQSFSMYDSADDYRDAICLTYLDQQLLGYYNQLEGTRLDELVCSSMVGALACNYCANSILYSGICAAFVSYMYQYL